MNKRREARRSRGARGEALAWSFAKLGALCAMLCSLGVWLARALLTGSANPFDFLWVFAAAALTEAAFGALVWGLVSAISRAPSVDREESSPGEALARRERLALDKCARRAKLAVAAKKQRL